MLLRFLGLGLTLALVLVATAYGAGSAVVEHWDGTAWTQQPVPGGRLFAIRAVSKEDVWALGRTFADHWDGSSWQQVAAPGGLRALSGDSETDIWAVGHSAHGTRTAHWDGIAWHVAASPSPTPSAELTAVSARAPKDAWAVGRYTVKHARPGCSGYPVRTLVLRWNGSRWMRIPSPNPAVPNRSKVQCDDELRGVAAVAPRDAWAVGTFFRRSTGRSRSKALVLHWDGSVWKRVTVPVPRGSFQSWLSSIVAIRPDDVWAVGAEVPGDCSDDCISTPLVEHWDGHAWKVVLEPPDVHDLSAFSDVSASSSGDVWAVGSDGSNGYDDPLIGHWDGNAWTLTYASDPGEQPPLFSVAALSPADVWAVP
jgi:hypothetical protein